MAAALAISLSPIRDMSNDPTHTDDIVSAEISLPGKPLSATISFFSDELGFRVDSIFPADAPRVAVLSGHGIRLRLDEDVSGNPCSIRLIRRDLTRCGERTIAPNGTIVEFVDDRQSFALPVLRPSLLIQGPDENATFAEGRAGMQYRDLIPGRFGGRFIASHIRIPRGGPVADYVHHHHIRFQMIFCVRGQVRVVYEDQGAPITMEAGDCFLQPPHIRHRVLESSDNTEVVEFACPAEHETCVDHEMELPNATMNPGRDFSGQRFLFHDSSAAAWLPWYRAGFEYQDIGISQATNGVASAAVIKASANGRKLSLGHDAEICFLFVLQGSARLVYANGSDQLLGNSSCAIPAGLDCELTDVVSDFTMLQVFVPSRQQGRPAR